jgi:hypothetical protein
MQVDEVLLPSLCAKKSSAGLQPEPVHREAAARYLAWRPPAASLLNILASVALCVWRGAHHDDACIQNG